MPRHGNFWNYIWACTQVSDRTKLGVVSCGFVSYLGNGSCLDTRNVGLDSQNSRIALYLNKATTHQDEATFQLRLCCCFMLFTKYYSCVATSLSQTVCWHCSISILSSLCPLYQVIPGLSSQPRESSEKPSDLFAYVSIRVLKEQLGESKTLWWQIRKCNLTKSTLVGGVTLAEVCKIVCLAFSFYREEKVYVDCCYFYTKMALCTTTSYPV